MIDLTGRYEVEERRVMPNASGDESHVSLAEDEYIVDTTVSRSGAMSSTVTVYVATPTTATRCMAITADDTRCQREAADGSDYCALPKHGTDE
jgi:hypothetical protein